MLKTKLFAACIAAALSQNALAGTDILNWTAPTQCVDGTPLATNCPLTGYKIEVAASPTATNWINAGTVQPNVLTITYTNTPAGTRCYRVYALSADGDSAPTDAVCKTQRPAPKVPQNLTVQ